MSEDRELLKTVFSPTPECPSLEELTRHPAPAQEVAECPRCATEVALYEQFIAGEPKQKVDEKLLRKINSRLPTAAPAPAPVKAWLEALWRPAIFAPVSVALAVLALMVGLRLRQDAPADLGGYDSVERGQVVELTSPRGEVPQVPVTFMWKTLLAAKSYRVRLMEVDRNVIWEAETKSAMVSIPNSIQLKVLPGKRLLWSVEALDGNGRSLGAGTQDFRRAVVAKGVGK